MPGPLTWMILLPVLTAAAAAAVDRRRESSIRVIGLTGTAMVFLLAAWVWARFAPGAAGLQFAERVPWVPTVGIAYHLGVDGLSVSLVALTALLFPLALASAATQIRARVKGFVVTVLLLEAGMLGMFIAQDLVLFYVFWEGMLIPMYFLIGLWGGPGRAAAAIKFFLYTMAGSVLMLLAIVAVYLQGGRILGRATFDLPALLAHPLGISGGLGTALFLAFAVAFAIKMPVWPLHAWLPDAYAEAPPVVTVLLASLMAKAGAYGLLRFCLPLFPEAMRTFGPAASVLAVVSILYGGAVAWAHTDLRRLLAYGSMSHMGFILLGIFALNATAVQGSLIQMINHGISTGALFFIAGMLIERTARTRTDEYGGVAAVTPALAAA
ncbi:MAG: NADH-quinone oxidoreductase subunit M, partial [Bacillati bacterium ANGP1]